MSNCGYRLLQLTNNTVGPVATATVLPIGVTSRKIACASKCIPTFDVTTTANNVAYINESGFYKITYTGYLTAGAAGNVVVNLEINNAIVAVATVTATAAGTVPVSITYITRVLSNCCNAGSPVQALQFRNAGVALTGGTSTVIIERVSG